MEPLLSNSQLLQFTESCPLADFPITDPLSPLPSVRAHQQPKKQHFNFSSVENASRTIAEDNYFQCQENFETEENKFYESQMLECSADLPKETFESAQDNNGLTDETFYDASQNVNGLNCEAQDVETTNPTVDKFQFYEAETTMYADQEFSQYCFNKYIQLTSTQSNICSKKNTAGAIEKVQDAELNLDEFLNLSEVGQFLMIQNSQALIPNFNLETTFKIDEQIAIDAYLQSKALSSSVPTSEHGEDDHHHYSTDDGSHYACNPVCGQNFQCDAFECQNCANTDEDLYQHPEYFEQQLSFKMTVEQSPIRHLESNILRSQSAQQLVTQEEFKEYDVIIHEAPQDKLNVSSYESQDGYSEDISSLNDDSLLSHDMTFVKKSSKKNGISKHHHDHDHEEGTYHRVGNKHRSEEIRCDHVSANNYYANGMCKNCYHTKGRTKKAHKCEHTDRPLYAKGICKNCYLSKYHKVKREIKRKIKQQLKAEAAKKAALAKQKYTKRGRPSREAIQARQMALQQQQLTQTGTDIVMTMAI